MVCVNVYTPYRTIASGKYSKLRVSADIWSLLTLLKAGVHKACAGDVRIFQDISALAVRVYALLSFH